MCYAMLSCVAYVPSSVNVTADVNINTTRNKDMNTSATVDTNATNKYQLRRELASAALRAKNIMYENSITLYGMDIYELVHEHMISEDVIQSWLL